MIVLTEKDFLEVKFASLIADYDKDTLINLYEPIIGFEAVATYLSLWSEANNQRLTSMISHKQLISHMRMSIARFVDARRHLEGVGLIKTYVSQAGETNIYRYELYAPKDPWSFFGNALLYGMLLKSIDETDANRLKSIYKLNIDEEKGKDITSSFVEIYHPDFDDPAFIKALGNDGKVKGRRVAKVLSEFSYEKFFENLGNISQIKSESFTKKEMKEIERLATLNGINEETAANDVAEIYDAQAGKGKHINFDSLAKMFQDETNYNYLASKKKSGTNNTITSDSQLAQKINIMESTSPKDYLAILQNGSKPASSDLRLINDLSSNFHLPNPVINAVIDFVLAKNNNILSRAYAEKVAASLAREGLETTVDAMNYLKRTNKKVAKKVETVEENEDVKTNEQSDVTMDWDTLFAKLEEGDNNGEN